jgi:hypothetical protein
MPQGPGQAWQLVLEATLGLDEKQALVSYNH